MKRYLALLRGINVGGKNKVGMESLKSAFEKTGFNDVSTYINSGNILFSSPAQDKGKLAAIIESVLAKSFGFKIRALVRDSRDMSKLIKAIPPEWQNDGKQKTDIFFLWDGYDSPKTLAALKIVDNIDQVIYVPGAIIWNLLVKNYGRSGMSRVVGTEFYHNVTIRNVNTVRKLALLIVTKP